MIQFSKSTDNYNLAQRTEQFSKTLIMFCSGLKQDNVTGPLINQLIRSGTSIGANYAEANNASSKKDFTNKIFISKKESQETKYWLSLIKECFPQLHNDIDILWKECHELNLIFQKITLSLKSKN